MSALMRAKFRVNSVTQYGTPPTSESLSMSAVTSSDKPFGPEGESEDNTFARYTPSASLSMSINNPALVDQIKQGDTFYVDFTRADA